MLQNFTHFSTLQAARIFVFKPLKLSCSLQKDQAFDGVEADPKTATKREVF